MGPLPLDSGVSKTGGWQHAAHGLHTGLSPQGKGQRRKAADPGEGYLSQLGVSGPLWPGEPPSPQHAEGAPRLGPPAGPPRARSQCHSLGLAWHGLSPEDCSALTPSAHLIRPPPEALLMGDHPRLGPSDHRGAVGGLSWVSGSSVLGDTGVGLCTRGLCSGGGNQKGRAAPWRWE